MTKMTNIALAVLAVSASATVLADNTVTGTYQVVQGDKITVTGSGNTSIGTDLVNKGLSNTAFGIHNTVEGKDSVVGGQRSVVKGDMSVAIGHHAKALESMNTAVGSEASAIAQSSTAIGKGTRTEGIGSTAVGAHAYAKQNSDVAMGLHANALGGQSTAIGQSTRAEGGQSTAIGSGATSTSRFSVAVGTNAKANNEHDVAIGSFSTTEKAVGTSSAIINGVEYGTFKGHKPVATVSVGKEGSERTITNVAAGRITAESTDAINGSQLYSVANKVGDNAKAIETLKDGVATNKTNIAVNANRITSNTQAIEGINNTINQHTTWNEAQDDQINELRKLVNGLHGDNAEIRKELHDNRREARAGIAGANAIAAIPQPHAPGQTAIGVGAGYFKNEGAAAVGVSHISDSGKWVSKAGINVDTRRNIGIGLGLSYVFGGVKVPVQTKEVVHEVVREVIVREVPAQPTTKRIRG